MNNARSIVLSMRNPVLFIDQTGKSIFSPLFMQRWVCRFFEIPIEDNWQILRSDLILSHPYRRDASTWFRGPSPPSSTCGWPISSCPWWTSIGRWWAGWCRGGEPTRPERIHLANRWRLTHEETGPLMEMEQWTSEVISSKAIEESFQRISDYTR